MKQLQMNKKAQGFTIIELVVVILLLGILTATALPRFMDVTDEAHESVVNAVEGGLNTSLALYRAEWYAKRQPSTLKGVFDSAAMKVSNAGFPLGTALANSTIDFDTECTLIFNTLLQENGRPSITTLGTGSALLTEIGTGAGTATKLKDADFAAYVSDNKCQFIYVGQYKNTVAGSVHQLQYDPTTGRITRGKL